MAGEVLLSVRDLAVDFAGDSGIVHAVRGVSFDIHAGQTLAIVGESGSGKSVSAQAILGILPKSATIVAGSAQLRDGKNNIDLVKLDPDGRAFRAIRGARIGMIFQEPLSSLSPVHTVGDQVTEALRLHTSANSDQAAKAAMALFEQVGFRDPKTMMRTYPFELSGGMRQRAMIAMALICKPDLLIADEPTTALDVTTQAQILSLLSDMQKQTGMAIMLVTHDLGVVANMADDVAVMYRGEMMERGPREAIFRRPTHEYLKALMRAVPRFGMKPGERLTPLREIRSARADMFQNDAGRAGAACDRVVLDVQGVSKTFVLRSGMWARERGRAYALSNVSLSLKAGKTIGLVGESGSGKTTLARIILGGMRPDAGRVMFDDGRGPKDITTFDPAGLQAYRRAIQFVFQDPYSSLNPRMTVYDILEEPLRIHQFGAKPERDERVKALMELVGLDPRHLGRHPHSFSGGQRQRIGLARALALSPSILICDEPTSALDVSVQAQVLNLLKELQGRLGLACLFVSHNLAVVDYMASEIAVMCRGHIVEYATRESLFSAPRHPYTRALFDAIPEPDIDRPLDFARLKQDVASDPSTWPAPFRLTPDLADQAHMEEVAPGHFVRVSETVPVERIVACA